MRESHLMMEAEVGFCCHKPSTWSHLELEEARLPPRAFRESIALPTASFWNSGFQKCEGTYTPIVLRPSLHYSSPVKLIHKIYEPFM